MKSVLDYLTKDKPILTNKLVKKYPQLTEDNICEVVAREEVLELYPIIFEFDMDTRKAVMIAKDNNIRSFVEYFELNHLNEVWVHGIVTNSQYNKEHEWNNLIKFSTKANIEFHPKYNLWKSKSQYTLTNKKDEYISHCQFDEIRIKGNKGITIVDGFSKEKGAYRMLFYAVLYTQSETIILSDITMSTQASLSWMKTVRDSSFEPFLYNTSNNDLINYSDENALSSDKSKQHIKVGISLVTSNLKILEDINNKIERNISVDVQKMILERLAGTRGYYDIS